MVGRFAAVGRMDGQTGPPARPIGHGYDRRRADQSREAGQAKLDGWEVEFMDDETLSKSHVDVTKYLTPKEIAAVKAARGNVRLISSMDNLTWGLPTGEW